MTQQPTSLLRTRAEALRTGPEEKVPYGRTYNVWGDGGKFEHVAKEQRATRRTHESVGSDLSSPAFRAGAVIRQPPLQRWERDSGGVGLPIS